MLPMLLGFVRGRGRASARPLDPALPRTLLLLHPLPASGAAALDLASLLVPQQLCVAGNRRAKSTVPTVVLGLLLGLHAPSTRPARHGLCQPPRQVLHFLSRPTDLRGGMRLRLSPYPGAPLLRELARGLPGW